MIEAQTQVEVLDAAIEKLVGLGSRLVSIRDSRHRVPAHDVVRVLRMLVRILEDFDTEQSREMLTQLMSAAASQTMPFTPDSAVKRALCNLGLLHPRPGGMVGMVDYEATIVLAAKVPAPAEYPIQLRSPLVEPAPPPFWIKR